MKAKLEQCKAELNSTTEGEEGREGKKHKFFKLGPSGANSNIISLTAKLHPPWPFILGCTWPHLLCFLQTTVNSVKEVSPRLESLYMWVYSFPSELQKYQKMLEPPPSAKPFIVDVDKKLEEGQKVISFLRY